MKKLRNYAIFMIIPLHLLCHWIGILADNQTVQLGDWVLDGMVLAVMLADFALSCWQMGIFSSQRDKVGAVMLDFRKYLLQKLVILAVNAAILLADGAGNIRCARLVTIVIAVLLTAGTLLSAVVTFVTAAGRTMLYHDKRGK